MKTFKLEIKLPTVEQITRGVKPAPIKAEQTAEEAARTLDERRKDFAEREKIAARMPERVRRGEVSASALAEALQKRDAAKTRIEEALADLTAAQERAVVEKRAATAALDDEFGRRAKVLEDVVDQINPVLLELRELAFALGRARYGAGTLSLDWADSPNTLQGKLTYVAPPPGVR